MSFAEKRKTATAEKPVEAKKARTAAAAEKPAEEQKPQSTATMAERVNNASEADVIKICLDELQRSIAQITQWGKNAEDALKSGLERIEKNGAKGGAVAQVAAPEYYYYCYFNSATCRWECTACEEKARECSAGNTVGKHKCVDDGAAISARHYYFYINSKSGELECTANPENAFAAARKGVVKGEVIY